MCTGFEGALVSAALSGVGMMMQQNAADDAAKQQQKIINQAAEETSRLNTKKANTIQDFATNTYDADARNTKYEDAATKNESSLVDALLSGNGGTASEVEQGSEGKLSNDYTRAKASATAAGTEDILKRARLMARNNAGSLMYGNEALKGGQLTSDIGLINGSIDRTNRAADTRLKNVNNSGSLAGGLLMGLAPAAGNYAGSVFSAKDLAPSASYGGILGMK